MCIVHIHRYIYRECVQNSSLQELNATICEIIMKAISLSKNPKCKENDPSLTLGHQDGFKVQYRNTNVYREIFKNQGSRTTMKQFVR